MFTNPSVHHIYDKAGTRLTLKQLLTGPDKEIWDRTMSMEVGRLNQGNDYAVTATDTIYFIPLALVPKGIKVTCASFVADYHPIKSKPMRIRCVVGGEKLD